MFTTSLYLDHGPAMMGTPISMVPLHSILGISILIKPKSLGMGALGARYVTCRSMATPGGIRLATPEDGVAMAMLALGAWLVVMYAIQHSLAPWGWVSGNRDARGSCQELTWSY